MLTRPTGPGRAVAVHPDSTMTRSAATTQTTSPTVRSDMRLIMNSIVGVECAHWM